MNIYNSTTPSTWLLELLSLHYTNIIDHHDLVWCKTADENDSYFICVNQYQTYSSVWSTWNSETSASEFQRKTRKYSPFINVLMCGWRFEVATDQYMNIVQRKHFFICILVILKRTLWRNVTVLLTLVSWKWNFTIWTLSQRELVSKGLTCCQGNLWFYKPDSMNNRTKHWCCF